MITEELFAIEFPAMNVYRMSRAKLEELRPSLMSRWAVVMTIIIGATVFISFRGLGSQTGVFIVFAILFLGGTFTLAIFRSAAKVRALMEEMATTFELFLDADHLIRRQRNLPEITIKYSDVRQIKENGSRGLIILGISKLEAVGITSAVENYEQLKADLVRLTGVGVTQTSGTPTQAWTYLAVLVVLGLGGVSFLASNRFVASG